MKRFLHSLLFVAFLPLFVNAQTVWTIDKAHSEILFRVKHMVISTVTGRFSDYDIVLKTGKDDFTDATVEGTVKVATINTGIEARDKHLQADDFFNAEKFPEMKFKSTKFTKTGDNSYRITGLLTIRDRTKEVTFDATYNGTIKSPWGKTISSWSATTVINRFDFDLKWNQALETGGLIVGSDVTIEINAEFTK